MRKSGSEEGGSAEGGNEEVGSEREEEGENGGEGSKTE